MDCALIDKGIGSDRATIVVAGDTENEQFWNEAKKYMEDLYGVPIRSKEELEEAAQNDEFIEPAESQFYSLKSGLSEDGWDLVPIKFVR